MNVDQITPHHRSRLAYVYIRQSTGHQVAHHPESRRIQRSFSERAVALGWAREQVMDIDGDLGESASRGNIREAFEQMVAEVALGKVGLILAFQASRLSRGNKDWYHLLDVCAVTRTLICDGEGLYDPQSYNDRLLLGLKGTMSEAELHLMKQRLVEAIQSRARRGAFEMRLPAGYVWDETGRIVKTADERIQAAIERVFSTFARLGTAHATHVALAEEGAQIPVASGGGQFRWDAPHYAQVLRMLKHPVYAGAYAYGQRQTYEVLDGDQRVVKRSKKVPREQWHALLEGNHEGYISWEQYEANQARIASNRRSDGPGAPREGSALLVGLVMCGRCGRRMRVQYGRDGKVQQYECKYSRRQLGQPPCQSVGALRLERAVEALLLEAVAPLGMEAMIEAAARHEEAEAQAQKHLQQQVEHARYEAEVARRYYDAVDPSNRLVAREVERRFEQALQRQEETEDHVRRRIEALQGPLTELERRQLRRWATDLPGLWHSQTTRPQDRKRIARCLVKQVVVTRTEQGDMLEAHVHWSGGEVTELSVRQGKRGEQRYATDPEVVQEVRALATEFTDAQIARILNRKGIRTSKGNTFTGNRIGCLRHQYGIAKGPSFPKGGPDIYTAQQAAELLGVTTSTIIRWIEQGLLRGAQVTRQAPWRVQVTAADRARLTAGEELPGWLTLKAAASRLGVSQQTVLQRLKEGRYEGRRVQTGGRSSWRIRVIAEGNDHQPTLFD